jgi:hypothetical protein
VQAFEGSNPFVSATYTTSIAVRLFIDAIGLTSVLLLLSKHPPLLTEP